MADYPDDIMTFRTIANLPNQTYDENNQTTIYKEDIEKLKDEIVAIQTVLGLNPNGEYDTVKDFIDYLYNKISPDIDIYQSSSQKTTTSTSYADLTGASVSITLADNSSGNVRLSVSCGWVDNSGDNLTYLAICDDSNNVLISGVRKRASNNNGEVLSLSTVVQGLTPGSTYTYKLRIKVSAGTGYYNSTVLKNGLTFIAEELI